MAGSIALFLMGLAVALAFLYFGLRWITKNDDQARTALSKIGIDPVVITPDPVPVAAPPPPPVPSAPPPQIVQAHAPPIVHPSPPAPVVLTQATTASLVDARGTRFLLQDDVTRVGREAGDIVLAGESTVSRNHAEITREATGYVLRDLGSTNGTFLNGIHIDGPKPIGPGDTVQFGAVLLRFEA